eukprot:TRINITY_DN111506_c0_g1_i1.p1 TRINITY_DN111506_c0_g1~~TRINITY_DN111506_c0_g1_i1.p1  ORF type:complete len:848 (-),score=284.16 TRINITY_DN111506_c0_g1_i1:17-2560(-)
MAGGPSQNGADQTVVVPCADDHPEDNGRNGGDKRVVELKLRRSLLHRQHDMKRLRDGKEDLNDALLDFFVKLGQLIIPKGGLEGGFPSVAYLGSHFFDVLQKGGAADGRVGHKNVANWAKRRLGEGGIFADGVGALAVPVNETLRQGSLKEKHWWLALLLNPRGGGKSKEEEEDVSVFCLDSLAIAEVKCEPPLRALKFGKHGYPLEVLSLQRQSFSAMVRFRARGDGSDGPLPDPDDSTLCKGTREFGPPRVSLEIDRKGGYGTPGHLEGVLDFALESSVLTSGEYVLNFGEGNMYGPAPRLRVERGATPFQTTVAKYLGGYLAKEWETGEAVWGARRGNANYDAERVMAALRVPDTPQQETANDCGYFMLEQILLALQLTADGFRTLARASTEMVTTLPWPTQKDIDRRKLRLLSALEAVFSKADEEGTDDVEALFVKDAGLRAKVQSAMYDGSRFADAVRNLAVLSAPRKALVMTELVATPTKALRALCTQYGVSTASLVERSDLLKALGPHCQREAPAASPGSSSPASPPAGAATPSANAGGAQKRAASVDAPGAAPVKQARPDVEHLASLKFAVADLDKMSVKKLRDLCRQHGVLPATALEKADFVKALAPCASDAPATSAGGSAGGVASAQAFRSPAKPASSAPAPAAPAAAAASVPADDPAARKARWAKVDPAQMHMGSITFELEDLDVMPIKVLRALCNQKRVLQGGSLEKRDFINALKPFVGKAAANATSQSSGGAAAPKAAAAPAAPPAPRKDYSKFLGSAVPNFTRADLEGMPVSTLRTLAIKHGVMPAGDPQQSELLMALMVVAVRTSSDSQLPAKAAKKNNDVLTMDDMLDDDD